MARSDLNSDILLDFADLLNQQNDFDEIIRLVSQQAGVLLHAQISLVMMLNPRTRDTVKTTFQAGNSEYQLLFSAEASERLDSEQLRGFSIT